jgi:hypothetical protein
MDWLQVVQSVTLILTLFVVWRYTRETARLRRATEDQASAFRDQVQIAQDQLRLARLQAVDMARPHLTAAFSSGTEGISVGFESTGQVIRQFRVVTEAEGRLLAELRYFDAKHRHTVTLRNMIPPIRLRAEYVDGIGTKYVSVYEITGKGIQLLSESNGFENAGYP